MTASAAGSTDSLARGPRRAAHLAQFIDVLAGGLTASSARTISYISLMLAR